jgi:peptidoglycan/xylan/chitin deacetylase (PgdA/CDA1 family)
VLCYHSVSDLAGAAVVEEYGVPPTEFRRQLKLLRRVGFRFVSLGEVIGNVHGRSGLPRRPLLITFDDCFTDLLDAAVPVLRAERVAAAAFASPAVRVERTNGIAPSALLPCDCSTLRACGRLSGSGSTLGHTA